MAMVDKHDRDDDTTDQPSQPSLPAHEQFTSLLLRHHAALLGYILSLVSNWSDAEDILQQASVVMWRKFGEFQPGSDFRSWGCQIAKFHALNCSN